ncbi:six-hairpin glycosidase-2 [Coleophoma crateriformis]|uniref:Six-hairpin glycosidase-2 n=1 Tax=Coleophoma crateriformis TaxID=565419 RepID=A0A3D8QYJ7_9HELO|nr:six-hairpin glycosidase-2 [Coleophoma crateriformis]
MFMSTLPRLVFWLATIGLVSAIDYTPDAELALNALQTFYNTTSGLWNTAGWWNAANCLTVIGDLAALDANVVPNVTSIMANTFTAAQKTNLKLAKVLTEDFNVVSYYGSSVPSTMELAQNLSTINPKGFLNGFYDDEGWWALGWIQAYDVTKNQDYLDTAAAILEDMKAGSTTPCGGIWWDKAHTYVNAIANELYFSVASHLANRIPGNATYYTGIATKQWLFLQNSGMINSKNTINDGLVTKTCKTNNATVWSYNQGVILGGLVELNTAAPNASYLTTASQIAQATMASLGNSAGVLHDPCEPNCGGDGSQFKGIFMRNLAKLQKAAPDSTILEFIATNAASVWAKDKTAQNKLGVVWDGLTGTPTAASQSSAMDALIAAVAFKTTLKDTLISI